MLEKLTGKEVKKLEDALLSAFPTPLKLKRMVRIGLEKNLGEISNEYLLDAVFKLIEWAESHGKIKELLTAACDEERGGNPGNPKLKCFCKQLLPQLPVSEQFAQNFRSEQVERIWLNPWRFDLDEFIRDCMKELLKEENKQGLVSIAVPYDVPFFSKNVCLRLKERLGDENIPRVGEAIKLEFKITKVEQLVAQIKNYENNLKVSDVIVSIQIDSSKRNSKTMAAEFWQRLCGEFTENIQNRLIIMMFCNKTTYFPRDKKVIILNPPKCFTIVDLDGWLVEITKALNWQHIKERWQKKIIQECRDKDNYEGLNIQSVYLHLKRAIPLVQERHKRQLSPEDFLNEI